MRFRAVWFPVLGRDGAALTCAVAVAVGAGRVPDGVVAVRRLSLLISAVVAVLFVAPATAQASSALPAVMASTGDSITRGFDATLFGCFLADCPADSWATGSATT